jgi:AraC-like DNA-binding protein
MEISYREHTPHLLLSPYIDAYWEMTTGRINPFLNRILPDGCVDIILNLGEDLLIEDGNFKFKNETVALVGTMTRYKQTLTQSNTHLLGIRFKPLGFSAFYKHSILREAANTTSEFEKATLPELRTTGLNLIETLDAFYIQRLNNKHNPLVEIVEAIGQATGLISVSQLAKNNYITTRQLERNFESYLGITPKAYLNFVRYQSAFKTIKQNSGKQSLLDIACDRGYYDHAHLSNEIKKHSGLNPSQLQ